MLKINALSKSFGEQILFENFSYQFSDTGLYVLRGDSGRGKTTLLRMIAGLDTDYTGTIEGAETCSYLFQDRRLFPTLNALDNVLCTLPSPQRKAMRETAVSLLKRLNLTPEDMLKKPKALSGGMQQRVAIARAILYPAPLLLLDEPSKEMDADNREVLSQIIREEAKKRLVILVTHDPADSFPECTVLNLSE